MPEMFTTELSGIDLSEDPIKQIYEDDPVITAKTIKWIDEWEARKNKTGCI